MLNINNQTKPLLSSDLFIEHLQTCHVLQVEFRDPIFEWAQDSSKVLFCDVVGDSIKVFFMGNIVPNIGWQINGINQGHAKFVHESGHKYSGEFYNDKPEGSGHALYANGDMYNGNWLDGLMNGYGIYYWSCGVSYEGKWKNGKRHGEGTMSFSQNYYYTGQWVNDKPHGHFTCSDGKGSKWFEIWGRGKLIYPYTDLL